MFKKLLDKLPSKQLLILFSVSMLITIIEFEIVGYIDDEEIMLFFLFNTIVILLVMMLIDKFFGRKIKDDKE